MITRLSARQLRCAAGGHVTLGTGGERKGIICRMQEQEDLTRTLASALWRSALSPYCRALDNWLAAEEMVAEALRATRVAPEPQADAAPAASARSLPSPAFPVDSVRDLAHCFWQNSARSAALTLDIWLAAERHVRAFCRAAVAGPGGLVQPFSAEAHWQRIRDHAERLWLEQGRPQDRDLDTWLTAEAEVLAEAAASGETPAARAKPRSSHSGEGAHAALRPPLALTMLAAETERGPAVEHCDPKAKPEHRGLRSSL